MIRTSVQFIWLFLFLSSMTVAPSNGEFLRRAEGKSEEEIGAGGDIAILDRKLQNNKQKRKQNDKDKICDQIDKRGRNRKLGTEDYKYTLGVLQDKPITVNDDITAIGTTTARAHAGDSATIRVPSNLKEGDVMFMFINGSAAGNRKPSDPSGRGWNKVLEVGPNDLNTKVFYKEYSDGDKKFKVQDGKNTYITIIGLRGVSSKDPVVNIEATRNSMDGKCGDAVAPKVGTSENGALIVQFLYDDPHLSFCVDKGVTELSSFQSGDDGVLTGITSTDGSKYGPIEAASCSCRRGGGNSVEVSMSVRRK